MNHQKLNIIPLAAALLLLSACSNDEPGNSTLPEGDYPLRLTATVGLPQSRAGGKDDWQGGEEIAVSVSNYTGKYVLDGTGNATASGTPYYWKDTSPATVRAWYPYAVGQQTHDISDQSQGYSSLDFLYAEAGGSYAAPVSLAFIHQMAKVSYTLVKGDGITDVDLSAATVTLFGDKSVRVKDGKIISTAASKTDEIVTYQDAVSFTGSAVMVPQNMTGSPMIKVNVNGTEFIYTPASEADGNLQSGFNHNYTITVKGNGIQVEKVISGAWIDGGSQDISPDMIIYDGTETGPKQGDYVYSDGTFSDGGLRKYYINGNLEFTDIAPLPDKTCVGIIFHLRDSSSPTDASEYSEFGNQEPAGYIVSIDQNSSRWANKDTNGSDGTPNGVINGYKYTKEYYAKYSGSHTLYALTWCMDHTTIPDAGNNIYSSWYLPSQIEYKLMRGTEGAMLNLLESNLQKASGAAFDNNYYFTCGLMGAWGNFLHMYNLKTGGTNAGMYKNAITATFPYRAVCAFRTN